MEHCRYVRIIKSYQDGIVPTWTRWTAHWAPCDTAEQVSRIKERLAEGWTLETDQIWEDRNSRVGSLDNLAPESTLADLRVTTEHFRGI